jgi:hypothetical protein
VSESKKSAVVLSTLGKTNSNCNSVKGSSVTFKSIILLSTEFTAHLGPKFSKYVLKSKKQVLESKG